MYFEFRRQLASGGRNIGMLSLLVLAAAACGNSGQSAEPSADLSALPETPAAERSAALSTPASSLSAVTTQSGEQQMAMVGITAEQVTVSPGVLRTGAATFRITNSASQDQEVEIEGPGEDGELDDLRPGETRDLQMVLQAGDYVIEVENEEGPDQTRRVSFQVRD